MDSVSESRLALVHPLLASKVRAMADVLAGKGIIIRVVQGLRTAAQQDELYAEGRTAPGPRVTNACGGYSNHNFGMAVDLIPGVRGVEPWKPNWSAASPDYQAMIAAGEAQGLVSGSRWKTMPDMPHFQLAGVPVTPTGDMRAALEQGLTHVWNTFAPEYDA